MRSSTRFGVFFVLIFASSVHAGGEHSGGGEYRGLQFKGIGYALVDLLRGAKNVPNEIARLNFNRLKRTIDETGVECTDELLRPSPNGKIVPTLIKDALNTPSRKVIRFNLDSWDMIPEGSRRTALVLHEYLGVMGVEDSDYRVSRHIYDHNALRLWFDHLEVAQSITENVPLDFPVECTYRYMNGSEENLGFVGFRKLSGGGEVRSVMFTKALAKDEKSGQLLVAAVTNTSDEDAIYFDKAMGNPAKKPGFRLVVGWSEGVSGEPKKPLFAQTIAISPNLKFEMDLNEPKLHLECSRVRLVGVEKPKDLDP